MSIYFKGISMLIGIIFGAGVFALPYAFFKAGLFWGILHFAVAFLIIVFLHLWYGEVVYYTNGRHRFTGYTGIFLGKKAEFISFLTTIGSYYGTLLVYGILGGIFLSNIFSQISAENFSFLFFIAGGIIIVGGLNRIATINFYLTIPLFGFIIYLFFVSLPAVSMENILANNKVMNGDWFLPYGVWLFALTGFAAVPELKDVVSNISVKNLKRIILTGISLAALFYLIFTFAIWGASGKLTTQDALSGIISVLGAKAFILGSFIGVLAVFNSYLALSTDMKNIFSYDFKFPKIWAWLAVAVPPAALFSLGAVDFTRTIGIIGSLGLGTAGIFIILMRRKMYKIVSAGDDSDIIREDKNVLKPQLFWETIILIGILAAVVYELWRIFV
jgi:amino acid permease